jgi:hypothetical protein
MNDTAIMTSTLIRHLERRGMVICMAGAVDKMSAEVVQLRAQVLAAEQASAVEQERHQKLVDFAKECSALSGMVSGNWLAQRASEVIDG